MQKMQKKTESNNGGDEANKTLYQHYTSRQTVKHLGINGYNFNKNTQSKHDEAKNLFSCRAHFFYKQRVLKSTEVTKYTVISTTFLRSSNDYILLILALQRQ